MHNAGIRIIILAAILSCIFFFAGSWKVFVKAGIPGWVAITPVLAPLGYLKIIGKSRLWLFVFPFIWVAISAHMAECFGKSKAWGIFFLGFVPYIGYCILGFGDAVYTKPAVS